MCGIGLIISGIGFDLSSISPEYMLLSPKIEQSVLSIEDLKKALCRRGPDSLGTHTVFLHPSGSSSVEKEVSITRKGLDKRNVDANSLHYCTNQFAATCAENGENSKVGKYFSRPLCAPTLNFIGATLQLRGTSPIFQPLVDDFENILVYNGEIFDGVHIGFSCNDSEFLLQALGNCCSRSFSETRAFDCKTKGNYSVPQLLSSIKGPWAVSYWQSCSRTLWFGRDAFGRRSLLVHWPTLEDPRLLLSSVAPHSSVNKNIEIDGEKFIQNITFWEELPCGVYSIHFSSKKFEGSLIGEVRKHEWTNSMLIELIQWERTFVEPKVVEQFPCTRLPAQESDLVLAQRVLSALRQSVMRRSAQHENFQAITCNTQLEAPAPVAILFSGGLDSMIIAALLDQCLEHCYGIDMLNVSFDGEAAPDRISAKAGIMELKRISPLRRWKLVEIDADLKELSLEINHVMSLLTPANTYMDLNIGLALWLAAGGDGCVSEENSENIDDSPRRVKYKSESRILLVGSGADEQCAGYGRHKTKFRKGGWVALNEEMRLDMQRIWKRNLGRDDRCISDNGKEARFPFLDEDVIRTLLDIPLWKMADLDQPIGTGDKKILREVARLLCLYDTAALPKRAIQFGSRIARECNRKNFGSNRAANHASAGSAVFSTPSSK